LSSDQIKRLGRDVDPSFDLGEFSGFGDKIVIPKKVAADCIIRYFHSDRDLLKLIAYMITREGQGMSGGTVRLKGAPQLIALIRDKNWIYDPERGGFYRDQSVTRTSDWGYLHEGVEYQLTLVSIDVIGSSELIHSNVKVDLETTLTKLRAFVLRNVEGRDGRLWFWYGDGGIAAFYGEDSCSHGVLAMQTILYYLPIFNVIENELRAESNFRLRIGIYFGSVEYKNDVSSIVSPSLKFVQEIEKNCQVPNSICISDSVYGKLADSLRNDFALTGTLQNTNIYSFIPR
jgi:class 3 adenylate cyclase